MKTVLDQQRTWLGLGAVTAVLLLIAGWFALISPVRADTASLADQEADARTHNAVLTHSIVVLRGQKADLPALRAALGAQVRSLPTDSGLPELTRQLTHQARTARVGVRGVAVGAVTPVVAPGTSGPATSPQGAAPSTDPAGQLFGIPVTVTTTGTAANQIAFLKALQQVGPRRALVVSTQLSPDAAASAVTTTTPATASIDVASTMTTVLTVFSAPVTLDGQAQLDRLIAGASTS